MTPKGERRLRNLFLLLIVVGLILLVAVNVSASPPPAAAGGSPRATDARVPVFVVFPLTNGTKNGTANGTTNHTVADIWGQINLLWGQLNAPGGLWSQVGSLAYTQFLLIVGEVVLGLFLAVGFVLMGRFVRVQMKALREERIGPEDPNLYAVLEPLLEKTLGPELGDYFDEKAKEDVMRRVRAKLKQPRLTVPGVAGLKRRPGTEDE